MEFNQTNRNQGAVNNLGPVTWVCGVCGGRGDTGGHKPGCTQPNWPWEKSKFAPSPEFKALKEQLDRIEAELEAGAVLRDNYHTFISLRLEQMERRQKLIGRLLAHFVADYMRPGVGAGSLKEAIDDMFDGLDDEEPSEPIDAATMETMAKAAYSVVMGGIWERLPREHQELWASGIRDALAAQSACAGDG